MSCRISFGFLIHVYQILTLSDTGAAWSKQLGLVQPAGDGLSLRTARYAMIIDDLVIKYLEVRVMFFFMRPHLFNLLSRSSLAGALLSPVQMLFLQSSRLETGNHK
jgi:Redoxin